VSQQNTLQLRERERTMRKRFPVFLNHVFCAVYEGPRSAASTETIEGKGRGACEPSFGQPLLVLCGCDDRERDSRLYSKG
jgi:hypothetical protein